MVSGFRSLGFRGLGFLVQGSGLRISGFWCAHFGQAEITDKDNSVFRSKPNYLTMNIEIDKSFDKGLR